jgi:hypothetical protein
MVPRIKERWLNLTGAILAGAVVAFLSQALSTSEGKTLRVNQELKEKADIEYVDQQDAALEKDLDDFKDDHVVTHTQYNEAILRQMDTNKESTDKKLDLILLIIEAEHD